MPGGLGVPGPQGGLHPQLNPPPVYWRGGSFSLLFIPEMSDEKDAVNIIRLGDQTLARHSVVVPDINGDIQALAEGMFDAMDREKGVGLAAVQVGRLLRLFITRVKGDQPRVFINPDILETSIELEPFEEGCLSIPGLYTDVVRPSSVRIQAWNLKGKPFILSVDGYLARVIQHEFDHLNGILFIDRIDKKKKMRLLAGYEQKVEA
jgi:peptide deformylase